MMLPSYFPGFSIRGCKSQLFHVVTVALRIIWAFFLHLGRCDSGVTLCSLLGNGAFSSLLISLNFMNLQRTNVAFLDPFNSILFHWFLLFIISLFLWVGFLPLIFLAEVTGIKF